MNNPLVSVSRATSTDRFFMSAFEPLPPQTPVVFPPLGPAVSDTSASAGNDQLLLDELKAVPTHVYAASHILTSASILIADKYFQDNLKILTPLANAELFRHRLAIVADLINQDYITALSKNLTHQVQVINNTQKRFYASIAGWTKSVEKLQRNHQALEKQITVQKIELACMEQHLAQVRSEAVSVKQEVDNYKAQLIQLRQEAFRMQYTNPTPEPRVSLPPLAPGVTDDSDDAATENTPSTPVPQTKRKKN